MSVYQIQIDDSSIQNQISKILDIVLREQLNNRYSDSGYIMSEAIRDLIYAHKEEILEKVIDRASKELVKKGLPKLIERMGD